MTLRILRRILQPVPPFAVLGYTYRALIHPSLCHKPCNSRPCQWAHLPCLSLTEAGVCWNLPRLAVEGSAPAGDFPCSVSWHLMSLALDAAHPSGTDCSPTANDLLSFTGKFTKNRRRRKPAWGVCVCVFVTAHRGMLLLVLASACQPLLVLEEAVGTLGGLAGGGKDTENRQRKAVLCRAGSDRCRMFARVCDEGTKKLSVQSSTELYPFKPTDFN